MEDATDLTEAEQQLLMAAAAHGLGPTASLDRANAGRVVHQVLRWHGLTAEQIDAGQWDEGYDPEYDAVAAALVRMVRQTGRDGRHRPAARPGPALFEGDGNWGAPGDPERRASRPRYNSCRLTAEGERLARLLLERPGVAKAPD